MEKNYSYFADFMLLATLFFSFGASSRVTGYGFEIFDFTKAYFAQKANLTYVKNIGFSYHGNCKIMKTNAKLSSWKGNGNEVKEDVMVLVQKRTFIPPLNGEAQFMRDIGVINYQTPDLTFMDHFEKSMKLPFKKLPFKMNDKFYSIMRFNHEKHSINTPHTT
ncbi:MAG: hypothetical protein AAF600_15155 [Bacteroidota bacterium]